MIRRILPKFEYTIKGVLTTTTFICYGYQRSTFNSAKFIALCLDHFRSYGLDTSKITIHTDNGAQSIGAVFPKRDGLFARLVEETFGIQHSTISPVAPCFNGSVEDFHGRI